LASKYDGESPAVNSEGSRSVSDHQAFWEDLRHDLEDPEFAREHAEVTALVQTLDQLVCNDE
jgi:hypothetical protein